MSFIFMRIKIIIFNGVAALQNKGLRQLSSEKAFFLLLNSMLTLVISSYTNSWNKGKKRENSLIPIGVSWYINMAAIHCFVYQYSRRDVM